MEHKNCKGCKWNYYPECHAKIDIKGKFERIDNLVESYDCQGFRDDDRVYDDSKYRIQKSELELKIEELEAKNQDILDRLNELEAQKL